MFEPFLGRLSDTKETLWLKSHTDQQSHTLLFSHRYIMNNFNKLAKFESSHFHQSATNCPWYDIEYLNRYVVFGDQHEYGLYLVVTARGLVIFVHEQKILFKKKSSFVYDKLKVFSVVRELIQWQSLFLPLLSWTVTLQFISLSSFLFRSYPYLRNGRFAIIVRRVKQSIIQIIIFHFKLGLFLIHYTCWLDLNVKKTKSQIKKSSSALGLQASHMVEITNLIKKL